MLKVINGYVADDSYLANEKFCLIQKANRSNRDKSALRYIHESIINAVILI